MHSPFSGDDGIAKRTGYRSNESSRIFNSCFAINCIYWIAGTGFSPFGVYSVGIAAIIAAICQSPEAHPDKDQRWLAAAVAGIFYLLAGLFGSAITGMMAALPVSWIQMLAGLALLSTIGGSLYQALHNERERDAAVVAFLVTASGLTLVGIGSAFWGLIAGGVCYVVLNLIADRNR